MHEAFLNAGISTTSKYRKNQVNPLSKRSSEDFFPEVVLQYFRLKLQANKLSFFFVK